jgi:hypothetical protein
VGFPSADRLKHDRHIGDENRPGVGKILNDGFSFFKADERVARASSCFSPASRSYAYRRILVSINTLSLIEFVP